MNKNDIHDAKVEYVMSDSEKVKAWICGVFFTIVLVTGIIFFLTGCTLSFQNISTHGVASDLVDEDLTTSPKTDANIPISLPATL